MHALERPHVRDGCTVYTSDYVRDLVIALVAALVADWGTPFGDGWERFRPDRDWPIAGLHAP